MRSAESIWIRGLDILNTFTAEIDACKVKSNLPKARVMWIGWFTEINDRVEDALLIRLLESGEVLVAVAEGNPGSGGVPKPEIVLEERVLEDDPLGGHVVVLGGDDGVVPRPRRRGLRGGYEGADKGLEPLAPLLGQLHGHVLDHLGQAQVARRGLGELLRAVGGSLVKFG